MKSLYDILGIHKSSEARAINVDKSDENGMSRVERSVQDTEIRR